MLSSHSLHRHQSFNTVTVLATLVTSLPGRSESIRYDTLQPVYVLQIPKASSLNVNDVWLFGARKPGLLGKLGTKSNGETNYGGKATQPFSRTSRASSMGSTCSVWTITEGTPHSSHKLVYSSSLDATPSLEILRRIILNPFFLCYITQLCQSGESEIRNCILR
jgi:hypothetical protein